MAIDHEREIHRMDGIRRWTVPAVALFPVAAGLVDLLWTNETYTQSVGVGQITVGLTAAAGLLHLTAAYIQGQHVQAVGRQRRDGA